MGIKDTEMVLDGAMAHLLNHVMPANFSFCRGFSHVENRFPDGKQAGALPRPQRQQLLE